MLFAITVGGGLFGVVGMIFGVPVMSIIYTVIREKTMGDTPEPPGKPAEKAPAVFRFAPEAAGENAA